LTIAKCIQLPGWQYSTLCSRSATYAAFFI
jgi:hypothetical protein